MTIELPKGWRAMRRGGRFSPAVCKTLLVAFTVPLDAGLADEANPDDMADAFAEFINREWWTNTAHEPDYFEPVMVGLIPSPQWVTPETVAILRKAATEYHQRKDSTPMTPSIGRIVHYTISAQDATEINRRRQDAHAALDWHRENKTGAIVHSGNAVSAGDVYPMIITRVWGDTPESAVNGQVLLDGNDLFWATSVTQGEGERTWREPVRV